jgi:hypothetical protein
MDIRTSGTCLNGGLRWISGTHGVLAGNRGANLAMDAGLFPNPHKRSMRHAAAVSHKDPLASGDALRHAMLATGQPRCSSQRGVVTLDFLSLTVEATHGAGGSLAELASLWALEAVVPVKRGPSQLYYKIIS